MYGKKPRARHSWPPPTFAAILAARFRDKASDVNTPLQFDLPNPFCQSYTINVQQIDGLGHTNNQVYINWCQEAAWAHSQQLGIGLADYQQLNRAMAIRHAAYDYLQASYLDEPVCVATWLTACDNRLQLARHFQILNTASGATLCRADMQLVCINLNNGKPTRMPELFKAVYGGAVVAAPA